MSTPSPVTSHGKSRTVALVTLGCARNDVDSEELAGRLAADGWVLTDDSSNADIALINTCGFIESAKKDSIDTLLQAHQLKADGQVRAVVAVGCMAERYGDELAKALPEADAILGFDSYADISERLGRILAGGSIPTHTPKDRRTLLPLAPAARREARVERDVEIRNGQGSRLYRKRLDDAPMAPLKIASGCDRRCSFCAIPSFRGSFLSRTPDEIVREARWLAEAGVSEIFLVSENTTSYGKDLGDLRLLERMLPELAAIDGIERIRLSYLQPAEIRPSLLQAMISTEKVVPYFDISFQHASGSLLRRMRRFGDREKFLHLLTQVRALAPEAGIRSNFIVGFPGEKESEYKELLSFIEDAALDAIGVFPYSDEDGTEAASLGEKISPDLIADRFREASSLAEEMVNQRTEIRIGQEARVLIESIEGDLIEGRAAHQGPEVDGVTYLENSGESSLSSYHVGQYVDGVFVASEGADLVMRPRELVS
ncbi:MAG: 30S ribosomal protein S12 methylthiotransferase RimO [Candidatus Nanopelagicaceae bacterium]